MSTWSTCLPRSGLVLALTLAGCAGEAEYQTPQLPPPPPPPPATEPAPLPEPYTQGGTPAPTAEAPSAPGTSPSAPPPPPPSPPPGGSAATSPPPPPPATGSAAQPAQGELVYSYPTGQWVYTSGGGWVWVPAGSSTIEDDGAPYVYLYTPAYGWTWYVSPWGWGPYHYGLWVRHPWHPAGMHGYWVARPRVVVRLGRGRR